MISKKIPPIVGWFTPEGWSHYSVIKGINKNYIFITDPQLNKVGKMKIEDFDKRWLNVDWENMNFIKKLIVSIKIWVNNKINKKNNFKLPLKKRKFLSEK
ncbi:hypothetical protein GW931_01050 [archaeon]|nr:hypothetical protein [archaeon]